jgi:hypothetical protein
VVFWFLYCVVLQVDQLLEGMCCLHLLGLIQRAEMWSDNVSRLQGRRQSMRTTKWSGDAERVRANVSQLTVRRSYGLRLTLPKSEAALPPKVDIRLEGYMVLQPRRPHSPPHKVPRQIYGSLTPSLTPTVKFLTYLNIFKPKI